MRPTKRQGSPSAQQRQPFSVEVVYRALVVLRYCQGPFVAVRAAAARRLRLAGLCVHALPFSLLFGKSRCAPQWTQAPGDVGPLGASTRNVCGLQVTPARRGTGKSRHGIAGCRRPQGQ